MAITPEFLFDFESNMQAITESEYARMTKNLWWQKIVKVRPSNSKRERIAWLLSTAKIEDGGKGGNISFDDLVTVSVEYENRNAQAGLELDRNQLEDLDGSGLDLAAKWSADIGAYMAYWPQKQAAKFVRNGENAALSASYDGLAFFHAAHPLDPFEPNSDTYANVFTGAANGSYPGALKIDASVSLEVAFGNLQKAIAYVRGAIKMPNSEDPRFLNPLCLIVPPALTARAQQLTNAKFIAQAASSGGGSGDIEAVIRNWGLAEPIEAAELGADFGGSDTSWYLAVNEAAASQLGALVYVDREPFKITYYTGQGGGTGVDAVLDRARKFEWHCQGRNVLGGGHPYLLFKAKDS